MSHCMKVSIIAEIGSNWEGSISKAKQIIKEDKNLESSKIENLQNVEVINQIKELKDLHDKGILNEDEFKKAKEKILK